MKKFISMVMAAAMVVSLVPATAFAYDVTSTAKVVSAADLTEAEAKVANKTKLGDVADLKTPELQLTVKSVDYTAADKETAVSYEATVTLDNAEWADNDDIASLVRVEYDEPSGKVQPTVTTKNVSDDEATIVITMHKGDGKVSETLSKDDKVILKLDTRLTKTSKNAKATVSVDSDDLGVTSDDLVFATVLDSGITATLKKVAEVAENETTKLERELKIKAAVGNFAANQVIELKLTSGFEWTAIKVNDTIANGALTVTDVDDNVLTCKVVKGGTDTITIAKDDVTIDAADSKVGAVAKITVKAKKGANGEGFAATADAVEAVKVVDGVIEVSVDEDEDLPVIYSGVNAENYGITDDSDHKALEVTIKEPSADTLDVKKELTMELPEGVYVVGVDTNDEFGANEAAFKKAYDKGDYETFKFARRALTATTNKKGELKFTLKLVAEPGFTGDVTLKVDGAGLDKAQEVKIAKFVSPYTVEASQNDLIIDYRNTKVPTNIVVKEAEEGLWKKDSKFIFDIEKMEMEDDATYTVDDKSDMEVKTIKNELGFKVDSESSDAAAAVTISDISLYMGRSLAAGAYDLTLDTTGSDKFMTEAVFGYTLSGKVDTKTEGTVSDKYYDNDEHFGHTVKEGFVNIITAGRDQDDASFTKKVVVPVGEKYIIAGEEQVALDVPAYISAQGYTMLPVRAVATALGINNNNVLWNQASRTVTILYGQRIITMVAGQKVVTVNGNTIPASATVQIKDGRTFLPMRDLATALGVTDITWDAATKTATMNGNQNK
nr:copper amine oxidase N-terminal domain-containing protein [uncultured Anaerotignum sp.]